MLRDFPSATTLKAQSVIPGFDVSFNWLPMLNIGPEDAYLCAINFMYELSSIDWEEVVPSGGEAFSKEVNGLKIVFESLAKPEDRVQLQNKHLVIGLVSLMNKMASKSSYCTSRATLYMYRKLIGHLAIGRWPSSAAAKGVEVVTSITGPSTKLSSSGNLTAVQEIVDPEDSDIVISYEMLGESISCQTLLDAALNGLAKSAPAGNDYRCRDFGGFSSSGEVAYSISGNPPGTTRFLMTYSFVRTSLKLLPARLYGERNCGEVKFDFFYRGEEIGGGTFYLS